MKKQSFQPALWLSRAVEVFTANESHSSSWKLHFFHSFSILYTPRHTAVMNQVDVAPFSPCFRLYIIICYCVILSDILKRCFCVIAPFEVYSPLFLGNSCILYFFFIFFILHNSIMNFKIIDSENFNKLDVNLDSKLPWQTHIENWLSLSQPALYQSLLSGLNDRGQWLNALLLDVSLPFCDLSARDTSPVAPRWQLSIDQNRIQP